MTPRLFSSSFFVHADAVVADGEGPCVGVGVDGDAEVLPLEAHVLIRQGPVAQLVDGVAGVGDDLPQEDLPVGVDGVDHQIQQALGFRLEFFLCHRLSFPPVDRPECGLHFALHHERQL